MLSVLGNIKHRLSHVNENTWHWKLVRTFYDSDYDAPDKACVYYWFSIPAAFIKLLFVLVILVFVLAIRLLIFLVRWSLGYSYKYNVFKAEDPILSDYDFSQHMRKLDGTKKRIAPWMILILPAIAGLYWLLVIKYPAMGIGFLILLAAVAVIVLLTLVVSASSKNKHVARARQGLSNAWDKVCPPLVIERDESTEAAGSD